MAQLSNLVFYLMVLTYLFVAQQVLALPPLRLTDHNQLIIKKGTKSVQCVERSSIKFDDLCLQPPLAVTSAVEACWMDDQLVYQCDKNLCEGMGILTHQTVPREATTCHGIPFANLNKTMMGRNYTCRTRAGDSFSRHLNFCTEEIDATSPSATAFTPPPYPPLTTLTQTPANQPQKNDRSWIAVWSLLAVLVVAAVVAALAILKYRYNRHDNGYRTTNSQDVHG